MKKLSDKDLYTQCKKYGLDAIQARRKFTGLLPEVVRRDTIARTTGKSWLRKRGFYNIYDFAAKLAGLSRDQVDEVLRLEKRFKDKPILHQALIQGKASVPKLVRVASIATQENQNDLFEKVQILSKSAIDIYVKEYKEKASKTEHQNSSQKPKLQQKSLYVQTFATTLKLDEDIQKQLAELQQKGIDINDLLRKFLKQREEKIAQEMKEISQEVRTKESEKATIGYPIGRYIQTKTKQLLKEKYGTTCSHQNCTKPAAHIHHKKPFAQHRTHDPRHLKPLCKTHHELRHMEDKAVQNFRKISLDLAPA